MKEVESQSEWVGKIVTCKICNRSYQIEAGDKILPGFMRGRIGGRMGGISRISMPRRFELACGHIWAIPTDCK